MIVNARRFEDRTVRLLVTDIAGAVSHAPGEAPEPAAVRLVEYAFDPTSGDPPVPSRSATAGADQATCVIIPTPDGDAIFIAGAQVERLPSDGAPLLDRAAAEAVAWRRRALRAARQQVAHERVVALGEQLNRETTIDGIYRAVMEHVAHVLGGHAVLVLERRLVARSGDVVLRAVPNTRVAARLTDLSVRPFLPLSSPGLVETSQAAPGQPFHGLAPLFEIDRAAAIAYVPIGDYGIVALIERRHERVFEPDDWFRFGAIARHVVAALDRVRLRQQTRALAMTDPLTGLGTMARLGVIAPYHLAAARRGTPLAIALFELRGRDRDRADTDGSIHRFAESLRSQARASDILIRAGDASFIALLPATARGGAHAFAARVRARTETFTRFDVGTAEFDPDRPTFAELLATARAAIDPDRD